MSHLHHKVSALIDGELGAGARSRALRHARGCDLCRHEIAETLHVKDRLRQLAPAEVTCDLRELVAAGSVVEPAVLGPALGPALRRVAVGLGSTSAFVFALAYLVGAPELNQAASVTPPVNEFAAEFADSSGLAALSDPPVDALMTASTMPTPTGFGTEVSLRSGSAPLATTEPGYSDTSRANETVPINWLRRAAAAPDRFSFRGVRRCRSYDDSEVESFTVAVRHVAGEGTTYQIRSGVADQDDALFIGAPSTSDLAAADRAIDRLAAVYDLAVTGVQQVLGRPATIVSVSQGDQVRARFWIDNVTGLLLRRDLYADGGLVRRSGYTSFEILRHGLMGQVPPELAAPSSRRISLGIAAVLTDRGWTYPARLGGSFRLSALRQVGSTGRVMSADYTDGLSTLSLFEERGTLDAPALPGLRRVQVGDRVFYVREGLPMTVVWQSGDTVFTLVTDLPEPMTAALVARFPSPDEPTSDASSGGSVADRVGNGLSRLVSAVAP